MRVTPEVVLVPEVWLAENADAINERALVVAEEVARVPVVAALFASNGWTARMLVLGLILANEEES